MRETSADLGDPWKMSFDLMLCALAATPTTGVPGPRGQRAQETLINQRLTRRREFKKSDGRDK
jgi:hypothetical protein